mgnify:CR=1 FL=1
MKCPRCGTDNLEDYRFCAGCGTKFDANLIQRVVVAFVQATRLGFSNYFNFERTSGNYCVEATSDKLNTRNIPHNVNRQLHFKQWAQQS